MLEELKKVEQLTIRLSSDDKKLLRQVCESRGELLSAFVRRSVRIELAALGYYDGATMKALGLDKEVRV